MTEAQTGEYIAERLRIAGTEEAIFHPDTVPAIHTASRGIPRIINLICEHALISAYVEERHQVSSSILGDVISDLDLEPRSVLFSDSKSFPALGKAS